MRRCPPGVVIASIWPLSAYRLMESLETPSSSAALPGLMYSVMCSPLLGFESTGYLLAFRAFAKSRVQRALVIGDLAKIGSG
jgi:hypothetical protein